MDKARLKMGSVPVRIAARVYGRDPAWVRAGIIAGWLPIGEATRNDEKKYPEGMLQRAAGWCKAVQGIRGKILSELFG